MRRFILTAGCMLAVALSCFAQSADAQCSSCGDVAVEGVVIGGAAPCHNCGDRIKGIAAKLMGPPPQAIVDGDGRIQPQADFILPKQTLRHAAGDAFSPNPVYAYSNAGIRAGEVHAWNQAESNNYSWHGGYNTWRFGQPTAAVVPPTASYQSSYAWGVGQVRSTPIHHQFGRGPGSSGGVAGGYQNTPYFPWSTNQFGYYPVRASW